MGLFSKGKSREELIAEAAELNEAPAQEEKKDDFSTGDQKLDIELTKIKGRLDGAEEVRKATGERFSRMAEQIGELRGMIVDTNKAMSKVEVSAAKAVDLVESVHPEKLMIEVRKQDGKIESVRAAIESNEAIMKDIMLEMKKMRDKMNFYKGVEQVIKLNDEIKQELATMKKVEATIERHADKVETVFIEVEKKYAEFDKFNDVVKDLDKSFKRMTNDFEKIKTKVDVKIDRKEFVELLDKFNDFEKHTTNLLKLLDERNKTVKGELNDQFKRLVQDYRKKLDEMRPPEVAKPTEGATDSEEGTSGEDGAGGDVKPGFFGRIKNQVKSWGPKKEQKEDSPEDQLFPEEDEASQKLKEMEQAQKGESEDKASDKPAEDAPATEKESSVEPEDDASKNEEPLEQKKDEEKTAPPLAPDSGEK